MDLFEATELSFDGNVIVEISIAKFVQDSGKVESKNGYAVWYQSFEDLALSMPQDITQGLQSEISSEIFQVPDIIINVMKPSISGKKRLGYIRIKVFYPP
jgi:hypothetical protein